MCRPIGSCPGAAASKSCGVHFNSAISGRAGAPPWLPAGAAAGGIQTFPSWRALALPGRRLSIGSTVNGSGSYSTWIRSIASAAVSSSTAATARIGSPSYSGSSVKPRSVCADARTFSPISAPACGARQVV